MRLSRNTRWSLRVGVGITLAFIYVPLLVIFIYAFNGSARLGWPPSDLTTHWFSDAFQASIAGPIMWWC